MTYGGKGFSESGGSGTVFVKSPNDLGVEESVLMIDNRNSVPNNVYVTSPTEDSCRTVIVTKQGDTQEDLTFDHVYMNGDAHLILQRNTTDSIDVVFKHLHGDLTGMIHTSVDQKIRVVYSDSPIPSSVRVYDMATIQLPEGEYHFFFI